MTLGRELQEVAARLREGAGEAAMAVSVLQALGKSMPDGSGQDWRTWMERVARSWEREAEALAARLAAWAERADQIAERIPGARVIEAQEEERRRLARDIHDGPAQILANVVFRIDVSQKLLERDPRRAAAELEQLKGLVRQSLQDVRRIIFDLRPMALDDLGLAPALRSYVSGFGEKTGLSVQMEVRGQERRLPPAVELGCYRLVQEALNNVWKHAQAQRATVRLAFDPALVRAEVTDDGVGFDPLALGEGGPRTGHFGLVSLRERAALLGGRARVDSAPGRGTRVLVELPAAG